MNNLHRELAPISDGAWAQIEEEATRTLKRHLAGRRVVNVHGPGGLDLSAIGTGHLVEGEATTNAVAQLPQDARAYPDAVAQAISTLRLVGVNGPYRAVLSADAYTAVSETRDHGYPVLEHIKRLVSDEIIWAPAIEGAFILTARGGDFAFHLGQDVSIGYSSHTDSIVRLYLHETFTFRVLTGEAAVALSPAAP